MAGTTSFYNINTEKKELHIGYTWFHSDFWGTHLNARTKLILLNHAFSELKFNKVIFSVDSANLRSCNALKKLGIDKEGLLKNHFLLSNGRMRDSIIFSVARESWSMVKKNIEKNI